MILINITAKILEQFRAWLRNDANFLFFWHAQDAQDTKEVERSLLELPTKIRKNLVNAIENLPSNPADQEAIISSLDETFSRWHEAPDNTNNSIVILSSPVTAVLPILSETLSEWAESKQVSLRLLPLKNRPEAIQSIRSELENYLKPDPTISDFGTHQPEIMVIPNLNWCFLRSLEGLEGIEYLQSLVYDSSKDRFWIIGAGQIGWEYLNLIYRLEAYCGKVLTLPPIEPEKLEAWLNPIVREFNIIFDKPRLDKQLLDEDKDNQTNYFERLAAISEGVSTVAIQSFLQSIRYEKIEAEDATKPEAKKLVAKIPKLPDLPTLESADQYILYALLLQDDLTISALAESLGDVEWEVLARVQILCRQGVIEKQDEIIKINPTYYPKLKQYLASNNFVISRK
ncbi:MAG: hypothetical protein AB4372_29100 [Xenococcus sp. (in: cyanobacteria)]